MQNRLSRAILTIAAVLAASMVIPIANAGAQNTRQPAAPRTDATPQKTPDFSGVWLQAQPGGVFVENYPAQPWVQELFKYAQDPSGNTRNEMDPNIAKCFPRGPTANWLGGNRPFEIFHVRNRVLILFEWNHEIRQIYTDGRGHPEDLAPTWMGHSIGKWEGDTLVVDTIGINQYTWLDRDGYVHSDALHLTERLRRTDEKTMTLDITFDDPKAYTKPFTSHRIFKLAPSDWEIGEHILCEDKLMGKPIADY